MKNFINIFCFLMIGCILFSVSSCGNERADADKTIVQTAYATAFRQPTSVRPVITTGDINATSQSTNDVTTASGDTEYTTVARTGKRKEIKQDRPMRNISSAELLTQINAGINLGASFDDSSIGYGKSVVDYEISAGNPVVSNGLIDSYYNAGFKAVRLPVSWSAHLNSDNTVDNNWLERIDEVVSYINSKGMYCIINSQNDQSWLNTTADFTELKNKFSAMWTSVAKKFASYNDRLLFEGIGELLKSENDRSEPTDADLKVANTLNELFVKTIRQTGGNNAKRHLVVSTYGSSVSQGSLQGFAMPADTAKNKLIAKVNIYLPGNFCLNESSTSLWGSTSDKNYISDVLYLVNQRFSALNVPVIIGEFGAVYKGNDAARAGYVKYFVETAYNYYMVCFWWDDGKYFRLFNRNDYNSVHQNVSKSIIIAAK